MINFSDIDIDEITGWSFSRKVSLFLAIFLLAQLVCSYLFLFPEYQELEELKEQKQQLSTRIEFKAGKLESFSVGQGQAGPVSESEGLSQENWPGSFLSYVSEAAPKNNLLLGQIQWGEHEAVKDLQRVPLRLSFNGGYHDFGRFTESVGKLKHLVIFEDIEWQRISNHSPGLKINIQAFLYLHAGSPEETESPLDEFVYTGHQKRDPFYIPEDSQAISASEALCLSRPLADTPAKLPDLTLPDISFKGTIIRDNRISALIETPSGELYIIGAGDVIGTESWYVSGVTDTQLLIEEKGSDCLTEGAV